MRNLRSQTIDSVSDTSHGRLTPILTNHLKDEAYIRLKAAIVNLRLPPGTPLIEARLAEQLGTSKTPVRHALIRLEKEGFVHTLPYRGTFVHYVTADDMRELFEVREALERAGARLACKRATPEEIDELRSILAETCGAIQRGDLEAAFPFIHRFHIRSMEVARSSRLMAAYLDIDSQMERIRIIAGHIPGRLDVSAQEHARILDAVEARDEQAAERAVHVHLGSLLDAYLRAVSNQTK